MKIPVFLFLAMAGVLANAAPLEISNVFARNGILQRGAPHPVWGRGNPGSTVTVEFNGQTKIAEVDAGGGWRVILAPMEATDVEQVLTVRAGEKRVQIHGMLVGDVWICVGDSLLALTPQGFSGDGCVVDSTIRQYIGRSVGYHMPLGDFPISSLVKKGTRNELKGQNMIAYGFAQSIRNAAGVPIYMFNVASTKHGSHLNWMAPGGHAFLTAINRKEKQQLWSVDPGSEAGKQAYAAANRAYGEWIAESERRLARGRFPKPYPAFPNEELMISDAYNAYLNPLTQLPCKGLIWFSMLRDNADAAAREEKLQALFKSWRKAFNDPDLPIYTLQLYDPFPINRSRPGHVALGEIPAALSVLELPHTGVAVSHDLIEVGQWYLTGSAQLEAGRRLGLWALKQVYGENVLCSGPIYRSHKVDGNSIRLTFDYADEMHPQQGDEVIGFQVADARGAFTAAKAEIHGDNTVTVWSDTVSEPTKLTYATSNAEVSANLVNGAGLPAAAFALEVK